MTRIDTLHELLEEVWDREEGRETPRTNGSTLKPRAKLEAFFLVSRLLAALDECWLALDNYPQDERDGIMAGIRELGLELANRGRLEAPDMTVEELAERAAAKGLWIVFRSPVDAADGSFIIGFTQAGFTGWNGRPDHQFIGPTAQDACQKAAEWLRKVESGEVDS